MKLPRQLDVAVLCFAFWLSALPLMGQRSAANARVERIRSGVQLTTGEQKITVQFYSGSTVRITKSIVGTAAPKPSLVVIQKDVPDLHVRFTESADAVTLGSAQVKVQISKHHGTIRYLTADNRTVLQEQGRAVFIPCPVEGEKSAFGVRQNFTLTPAEGLYGLGQHQSGYMNYRGRTVNLVQANTEAVTPVLVSTAGYGILWDNYSKTIFSDKPEGASLWSEVADGVDYYFFFGPTIDQVIAGYRQLTGQAPMYGKWAYGYWQSKGKR